MPVAVDAHELHVVAAGRLRREQQRYTHNRRVVVEVLAEAEGPVAIGEILERRPELAQSSTYRNLAVLERAGVVRRVAANDEWSRFELAEDLTEHHHHHLICTSCGTVIDFTVPDALEADLAVAVAEVARATGFRAEHHRLDLLGRCADCG